MAPWAAWTALGIALAIVVVFAVLRIVTDVDNIGAGASQVEDEFDRRYAEHPILAYAHILPGLAYLTLAPFQIARTVRRGRLDLHRRLGRILVVAGLVSGAFAIALGVLIPFGGLAEASASLVFGTYFVGALALAYRAIRRRDVTSHRAWMIRAFAIGSGVGSIRLVIGLSEAFGLAEFDEIFGPAFWIAFSLHALLAEAWLRARPRAA